MFQPFDYPLAFASPRRVVYPTCWAGHIPFAFALMQCHRPQTLVELGTHTGVSYSAFCQAVECLMLPAKCYAVDTWKGDEQSAFYGEEVFEEFSEFHDRYYNGFSKLMRMRFDEAVTCFEDGTLDLLHIDGCHFYDAVRNDFETWLPKMSSRGVILLHDTFEKANSFGVGTLLNEVRSRYPVFEFTHSWGLGVIATGPEAAKGPLGELFRSTEKETVLIRRYFSTLGQKITLAWDLQSARENLTQRDRDLQSARENLTQRDRDLQSAREELMQRQARQADMERRMADLESERVKLEEHRTALQNSLSWRLMGPFRKMDCMLGKIFHRNSLSRARPPRPGTDRPAGGPQ